MKQPHSNVKRYPQCSLCCPASIFVFLRFVADNGLDDGDTTRLYFPADAETAGLPDAEFDTFLNALDKT